MEPQARNALEENLSVRIPSKRIPVEKGSRFAYVQQPLPPWMAAGGAIEIDGRWFPVECYFGGMIDKRRLKRNIRRAAQRRGEQS